jgi:outer membrane autotransporter protein
LSLGVDTLISVKDGQLLAGILSGYSDSALDFQAGTSAKTGSYYLGGYASWLFSNDYYVDGLVKVNRFDNKSDVRMSTGTGTGDSYSNHGAGVVLEFGRYIALHSDWFIEPFTRWTALWVEGKTYTLSNLTNANNHPAYSWLTHIGATVGRNFQSADGTIIHPYMTVSLVRELAKKTEITVNRDVFHHERSGTRGDVSIGVAAQYSPNFQLHANIDYSKGQKIEQPWELNLGVRYVW